MLSHSYFLFYVVLLQRVEFVPDEALPIEVSNLNSVVTVSCGDSHTAALTYEGRIFACGSDIFGQLGCGRPSLLQNSMRGITEMLGSQVTRVVCGRYCFS